MLPARAAEESTEALFDSGRMLGGRLSHSVEKCSSFVNPWVLYRWCRMQGIAAVVAQLFHVRQSRPDELLFCPQSLVLVLFGDSTCRLPLDSLEQVTPPHPPRQ